MGKSLLLAASLTFLCANLFGQSINSVTVSPQDPTSNDDVMLVINGSLWSSDISINSISVVQNFNTWTVDIEFVSGGIGLPVVLPFDTIVSLGTMSIGYYDCQVNGIMNSTVQDFDGTSWAVLEPVGIHDSREAELKFMCTPNPFMEETTLTVSIPKGGNVQLQVYDILGQKVAEVLNQHHDSGVHQLKYLGTELPAGRYYFHLLSGGEAMVYSVLKK